MKVKLLLGAILALILSACSDNGGSSQGPGVLREADYEFIGGWGPINAKVGDRAELAAAYRALRDDELPPLPRLTVIAWKDQGGCAQSFDVLKKRFPEDLVRYVEQNCYYGAELMLHFYAAIRKDTREYVPLVLDAWALYTAYDHEGSELHQFFRESKSLETPTQRIAAAKIFFHGYNRDKFRRELGGYIFGLSSLQYGFFLDYLQRAPNVKKTDAMKLALLYNLNPIFAIVPPLSNHVKEIQKMHEDLLEIFARDGSLSEITRALAELRSFLEANKIATRGIYTDMQKIAFERAVKYIDAALLGVGVKL